MKTIHKAVIFSNTSHKLKFCSRNHYNNEHWLEQGIA